MADTHETGGARRLTPELTRLRKVIVCRCNERDRVGGPGRGRRVARAVEAEWRAALAELGLRPSNVFKPGSRHSWRKGARLYVRPAQLAGPTLSVKVYTAIGNFNHGTPKTPIV